jgi:hypothetical protein
MFYKRNLKTGLHRVKLPGAGWQTIRPGQSVVNHQGVLVDCSPEVFGTQLSNYTLIGGATAGTAKGIMNAGPLPPQARYEMRHRGRGMYDVVNPDNPDKPMNDKPIRKGLAEELITKLLGEVPAVSASECPYEEGGFGKSFDNWTECDACPSRVECAAAMPQKEDGQ